MGQVNYAKVARHALKDDGPDKAVVAAARTFALLKPDAVRRGLVGEIVSRLEGSQFEVRKLELIKPTMAKVADHYKHHAGQPYFGEMAHFVAGGPVVAMVIASRLSNVDAVKALRDLMGHFAPSLRKEGTIRGDLMRPGDPVHVNLIHGSDSPAEAEREAKVWFDFDPASGKNFHNC